MNARAPIELGRLTDLSAELETAAVTLKDNGLSSERAGELAQRCAELAAAAAAEIDRLAGSGHEESLPGQGELL